LSDIRANTISDAAGTGPIDLYKQSAAKAWSNHNPSVGSIRDSFNISSITDLSTAADTLSFSSAMSSADYGVSGTANGSTSGSNVGRFLCPYNYSTSSITAVTQRADNSAASSPLANLSIHGDLA